MKIDEIRKYKIVLLLVLINVGVFTVFKSLYRFSTNEIYNIENYRFVYSEFSLPRLIAVNFMHGRLQDLLSNILFLIIFGAFLERRIGSKKLAISYIITGVVGILAQGRLLPAAPAMGASASVDGLIGISLIVLLRGGWRVGNMACNFIMVFLITVTVLPLALPILPLTSFSSFVAKSWIEAGNYAHLYGFASGVCIAILFRLFEQQWRATSTPPPPA